MSLQVLCSLLLDWQYICSGGSSNLLPILPIKYLSAWDSTYTNTTRTILRELSVAKYGTIGHKIPILDEDKNKFLDLKLINKASKLISKVEVQITEL